ncbi:MAG: acetylxylan esterase [Clostridia bacterium]|nr:acetylxylan esterase [Clostridia bacterium]
MKIPEILTALSGERITSTAMWEKHRRDEIYTLFENFVYGVAPECPKDMRFSVKTIEREHNITQKKADMIFPNFKISADIFVPTENTKKLPAYLLCMHQFEEDSCNIDEGLDFEIVPILDIVERGYAIVTMKTSQICPDVFTNEPYGDGIFKWIDYSKRDNSWSIIASWAWGLSRVMDYLQTDEDIDESRVAVIGHSRSGKTALWAGASDKRFAMVVSNDSGCTGAAMTRGKKGEHVKDINDAFHWFCENYIKYNDDEDMLPIDQHMLLALIAPRPLYVASSSLDEWADPDSELRSCRFASEIYELYGLDGVIVPEGIEENIPYHGGMIAYHCKTGEHGLTKQDWNLFLDFSDIHLK